VSYIYIFILDVSFAHAFGNGWEEETNNTGSFSLDDPPKRYYFLFSSYCDASLGTGFFFAHIITVLRVRFTHGRLSCLLRYRRADGFDVVGVVCGGAVLSADKPALFPHIRTLGTAMHCGGVRGISPRGLVRICVPPVPL